MRTIVRRACLAVSVLCAAAPIIAIFGTLLGVITIDTGAALFAFYVTNPALALCMLAGLFAGVILGD